MQTRSMVAAKSTARIKALAGVIVKDISTDGPINNIGCDNIVIQDCQAVMVVLNQLQHVSISQSSEPLPPDKTDKAAPSGGITGRLPQESTVQRLELEVAAVCKEFKRMLRNSYQQSHPAARRETALFREKCGEVVKDSISCADEGVICALHHLNDLYCTIKAGGSAADIEWHLKELHREAVEGERRSREIQAQIDGIEALEAVTGWWQQLIEGLKKIEQSAKKDAHRTMELIEERKYLGVRFRAYVSQMMILQDRYPLSPSPPSQQTKKNTRAHGGH
ncbi:hypothetical protein C8J56DRAFT_391089 [Mycena floridula]|nr:hypothetical protein C8J56DRAFT_391089 [Mycena floridula]